MIILPCTLKKLCYTSTISETSSKRSVRVLLTPEAVVNACIIHKIIQNIKACEYLILYILGMRLVEKKIIVRGKEENNCSRKL